MIRGRRPLPTVVKAARGNPGKRKLNTNEPKFSGGTTCPSWLDKDAKGEWRRLAPQLEKAGLLTVADRAVLAAYCQAYSEWKKACQAIEKHGEVVEIWNDEEKKSLKYLQQSPWVNIRSNARLQMVRFATEFGLTPSSRSRVGAGGKTKGDVFKDFLGFNRRMAG